MKNFAIIVLLSFVTVTGSEPAHATARAEIDITGATVTRFLTDGTQISTPLPTSGLFLSATTIVQGPGSHSGDPFAWFVGPDLLPGESATFSFNISLSVFDQGLFGANGINHYRINPPVFSGTVGITDEIVPAGYEAALASIGVGSYIDCRSGSIPVACPGVSLTQFGFQEIRTNQDNIADTFTFSGIVSGTVSNFRSTPQQSVVFVVESLYALSVPEPSTYGMLFAGLGLLGFVTRRRT